MKLIAGLGNPGKNYENTFHNLGFMAVDAVADILCTEFNKEKCRAMVAETRINNEKVILAKPLTFMNLSGESIRLLMDFYKIPLSDFLVIYDDYDLKKGVLRIRESGSAGTHNGMRNIISQLGSGEFARIRIGFNPGAECRIPLIDYVLSSVKDEDKKIMYSAITRAANAASEFARGVKIQDVMQKYNGSADIL